jgi:hypothetical protein
MLSFSFSATKQTVNHKNFDKKKTKSKIKMSIKEMRLLRLPRDLNRFNTIDGGNRADGSKDRGF